MSRVDRSDAENFERKSTTARSVAFLRSEKTKTRKR